MNCNCNVRCLVPGGEAGRGEEYTIEEAIMTQDQFDRLEEFQGF